MSRNEKRDIEKELRAWLERKGQPFEMVVGQALRKSGFYTRQATYYLDPDENKLREIDVVATRIYTEGKEILEVGLAVECKVRPDVMPWMVFAMDEDPRLESRVPQPVFDAQFDRQLAGTIDDRLSKAGRFVPAFSIQQRWGHGIAEARLDKKQPPSSRTIDAAFEACLVAAKAARALAARMGAENRSAAEGVNRVGIIFPVVVLKGRLFEYSIDTNGSHSLREVMIAHVSWHSPPCTVFVITEVELSAFINQCKTVFSTISDLWTTVRSSS